MSGERPILIVDDDATLRNTLVEQLEVDGEFVAFEASTITEAESLLGTRDARFDALILDVGLPDGDGRDLCASMRKSGLRMPIIMLTGSDEEADVIRGLDAGANDYIAKPFRLAELLARLRAQVRIFENSEDAVFTIGPYTFRPSAKLLQEPIKNRSHPADRERGGDPEVPLPSRNAPGRAAGAAQRGLGLQRERDHAHARNPYLSPAPKNRARPRPFPPARDRRRRLPARPGRHRPRRGIRITRLARTKAKPVQHVQSHPVDDLPGNAEIPPPGIGFEWIALVRYVFGADVSHRSRLLTFAEPVVKKPVVTARRHEGPVRERDAGLVRHPARLRQPGPTGAMNASTISASTILSCGRHPIELLKRTPGQAPMIAAAIRPSSSADIGLWPACSIPAFSPSITIPSLG